MIKKMVRLNPNQMAYQDRGKMKWQGLLLSDHSEALKKPSLVQEEDKILPKTRLSLIDLSKKLALAYQKRQAITVQTNILTKDHHLQEFKALVAGSDENEIYFSLKNGQLIKIPLENISYVELFDHLLWQKSD